jgi:ParB-like chromosome segregation protein Spo0J
MSDKPEISVDDYEIVEIDRLSQHPENPRRGTVSVIVESIREHGQYRPIVAQRSTGHVLAGNHTLIAAREAGMDEIAVSWIDVSDEEARRIMLVDNRASDLGTYDDAALVSLLRATESDFGDLIGTGYDDAALDDLIAIGEARDIENAGGTTVADPQTDGPVRERAVRTIALDVTVDEYDWWNAHAKEARQACDVDTNSELILHLIAQTLGIVAP